MGYDIKSTQDVVKTDGVKILMYAESGFGKTTSFGSLNGSTLVLSLESGLMVLRDKDIDSIHIDNLETLGEVYMDIKNGKLKYDNICVDSLSEIGELFINDLEEDDYYGNPSNVFKLFGEYTRRMIKMAKAFRDLKGCNVILTALAENVEANGTVTKLPMIPAKKAQAKLISLFDEVYYGVTKGEGERILHTEDGVGYRAKSRAGIFPREINMTKDNEDSQTLGDMVEAMSKNKLEEGK